MSEISTREGGIPGPGFREFHGPSWGSEGRTGFRAGWALPLGPVALCAFLLAAMITYRVQGAVADGTEFSLRTLLVGLYESFGFEPMIMVCVLALAWSSIWFLTGRIERPLGRMLKIAALGLCLAILVNLRADGAASIASGEIGSFLAGRMSATLTPALSIVLVGAASIASLLLATDFFFYGHFDRLARRSASRASAAAAVEPEAVAAFEDLRLEVPEVQPAPGRVRSRSRRRDADAARGEDRAAAVAAEESDDLGEYQPIEWSEEVPGEDEVDGEILLDGELDAVIDESDEEFEADADADAEGEELGGDDLREAELDDTQLEHAEEDDAADAIEFDEIDSDERESDERDVDEVEGSAAVDHTELDDEPDATEDLEAELDNAAEPVHAIPRPAPASAAPDGEADDALADDARADGAPADDALLADAEALVLEYRRASANFLKRRLRVSTDEAMSLLHRLAARGVVECEAGAAHGRVVAGS